MCGAFVTDTDTVPLPVAELVEAPGQTMEQIRKKDIKADQLKVVEKITDKYDYFD